MVASLVLTLIVLKNRLIILNWLDTLAKNKILFHSKCIFFFPQSVVEIKILKIYFIVFQRRSFFCF